MHKDGEESCVETSISHRPFFDLQNAGWTD